MTREVLDAIPTGRNIQAVGIMIPGTTIALGGGGALSRDVGGSGSLQQSPLQYRGSADTVQTIEGMRLNNLCANGAVQRRLLERRQLPGIQLRDRRRLGRNGPGRHARQHGAEGRRQLVPRHRCSATTRPRAGRRTTADRRAIGQPCTRSNLTGDTTFNKTNNFLTNVSQLTKNYDFNPGVGGPIAQGQGVVLRDVPLSGREQDGGRQLLRRRSVARSGTSPTPSRPGIDDGHIRSIAGRVTAQLSAEGQDLVLPRRTGQGARPLGHRVERPARSLGHPGDADQLRVGRRNGRGRTTNRLLLDAGLARLQPGIPGELSAGRLRRRQSAARDADRQQHRQERGGVEQPGRPFLEAVHRAVRRVYVTGSHSLRFGATISQAKWRLTQQFTGDVQPVTYNGCCRRHLNPVSVTLRIPTDRRNSIKNDSAVFAQDKWTIKRATINAGVRWDWFISATRSGNAAGQHVEPRGQLQRSVPTARTT